MVLRCLSPSPHLIAVTETCFNNAVPDAAVAVPGYSSVFRTDRLPGRRRGGVLILAKDGVKCWRRNDLQVWAGCGWIEVAASSPSSKSFIVGCVYRPPSAASTDIEKFVECLESTLDKIDDRRSHVVLLGDLNCTSPAWCASDAYNCAGRYFESVFPPTCGMTGAWDPYWT